MCAPGPFPRRRSGPLDAAPFRPRRQFEREENVGDTNVLLDAAKAAGLDPQEAQQALEKDSLKEHVSREVEAWREKHRISGVPFFVINVRTWPRMSPSLSTGPLALARPSDSLPDAQDGRATLSGAQESDALADTIRRAASL